MKMLRLCDTLLLICLSFTAIIVGVCDFAGIIEKISWFPHPRYDVLLLILFGTIGLHLGVSHIEDVRFHDSFEGGSSGLVGDVNKHIDQLVQSVHGIDLRVFRDAGEQEVYLAKRVEEAQLEVCDLTWKEKVSLHSSLPPRLKSHKTYEGSIAKAAKRIPYREVFVFSDVSRKEKLQRRLQENLPGYSCRYFEVDARIPRLQFVVIDRTEVVFASSAYPTLCAVRQMELASLFQAYFNSIWEAAIPLKDGPTIHRGELAKILPDNI